MKILIGCFLLFSIQIFSQSFLNILFCNGTYKNAPISSLQKITLDPSSGQISFYLVDGNTATESIADIRKMTLGNVAEGELLPVELSSFSALLNGTSVVLMWRTETEVSNYGFEIERNRDSEVGNLWKKIGFVEGSGNSNSPKNYSFTDINPPSGIIHYRLKQIDTDGKYQYSNVLNIEPGIPVQYALKQNFHNPFNPATHINYNLPSEGFVTLKVYDIAGREVATLVNENKKAGSYLVTFDGNNFASGVYLCRIYSGNYSSSIKMLMIK
jgi:Secretion system C-terminal sorting domain